MLGGFKGTIKHAAIYFCLACFSQHARSSHSAEAYCRTQIDEARLKSANLELPKLVGDVDRRPDSTYEDVIVNRFRAGIAYDLHGLKRSFDIRKLADIRCDGMQKSLSLKAQIEDLIYGTEKKALLAKAEVLEKGISFADQYLKESQKRLSRNDESSSSVESIAKKYFQLVLLKQEVEANIKKIPATESSPEDISLFTQKLSEVQQINAEANAREAELVGDPDWKLSVSGGFQKQVFSPPRDRFEAVPLYATLSVEIPIGLINRSGRKSDLTASAKAWQDFNPEGLATHLTANEQFLKEELQLSNVRLEMQTGRKREVESHLRKLQGSSNSFRIQIFDAQIDQIILNADIAYNQTKRDLLAKGFGKSVPSKESNKNPMNLRVTEGDVSTENDAFATASPKLRATFLDQKGTNTEVTFKPLAQTETVAKLKSGLDRTQFGIFVAAVNQCNLLYIMWRIQPSEGVVVQKKLNPGKSTHQECGNDGYVTIKPTKSKNPGAPSWGQDVTLNASIAADELTVKVKDQIVWQGKVNLDGLDQKGSIGVRSDNVKMVFRVNETEKK